MVNEVNYKEALEALEELQREGLYLLEEKLKCELSKLTKEIAIHESNIKYGYKLDVSYAGSYKIPKDPEIEKNQIEQKNYKIHLINNKLDLIIMYKRNLLKPQI